ncbi:MAG: hypothetical protein KF788_12750 [Piscinibacter sp.]|nr:hypothetical protein [Piscinibacter sp.]
MLRPEAMRAAAALLLGLAACSSAGSLSLPSDLDLAQIQQDGRVPHEQAPQGVPRGYDWARGPRVGAGNQPGRFRAATGWGQSFRAEGSRDAAGGTLQVRDLQVLLCVGPERAWQLVQRGPIEGRQFRADFGGDLSRPPPRFEQAGGVASVVFEPGAAFHFWPAQGRFELPAQPLCGVLVLLQARVEADRPGGDAGLLLGLGADYWADRQARWDHFRTNRDIAIGRLRRVTPEWRWYGLSTASDADLQRLSDEGYTLAPALCATDSCR